MILNNYKYLFCDGSYYLKKSVFISWKNWIDSGKTTTFSEPLVARMMMYSINKAMKELGGADKAFIVWDQWDSNIKGYYITHILKSKYKDDREWVTKDDAEKEGLTDEEKQAILDKSAMFDMQVKAKRWIIENLGKVGLPSIRYPGYECDQLIYVYAALLFNDNKKSVIASSDSDWSYIITPNCDHCKVGVRGKSATLITYNDFITSEIPEDLLGKISLYDWKSYYDSIEGSHNNMRRSRRDNFDTKFIIHNIVTRNDYTGIEDPELFKLQYSTFNLSDYPNFNRILKEFPDKLKLGSLMNEDEFVKFSEESKLGVSKSWYSKFINSLDYKLYDNDQHI